LVSILILMLAPWRPFAMLLMTILKMIWISTAPASPHHMGRDRLPRNVLLLVFWGLAAKSTAYSSSACRRAPLKVFSPPSSKWNFMCGSSTLSTNDFSASFFMWSSGRVGRWATCSIVVTKSCRNSPTLCVLAFSWLLYMRWQTVSLRNSLQGLKCFFVSQDIWDSVQHISGQALQGCDKWISPGASNSWAQLRSHTGTGTMSMVQSCQTWLARRAYTISCSFFPMLILSLDFFQLIPYKISANRQQRPTKYSETCIRRNRMGPKIFSTLDKFPHYTK
jgi:hypothetical protein